MNNVFNEVLERAKNVVPPVETAATTPDGQVVEAKVEIPKQENVVVAVNPEKVEAPPVTTEGTPPEGKKKLLFEVLGVKTEETLVEPPIETKNTEIPQSIVEKLKKAEETEKAFKEFGESWLFKAIQLGKDPFEFAKKLQIKDYSSFGYKDLVKEKLTEEGLSGEDLEDAINDEADAFDRKSPLEKRNSEKELRGELQAKQKLSDEVTALTEEYSKAIANQPVTKSQEEVAKDRVEWMRTESEKDMAAIDSVLSEIEGAEAYGLVIDKSIIEDVRKAYNFTEADTMFYDKTKETIDAKKWVLDKLFLVKRDELLKAAFEQGKKEGAKDFINPDKSSKSDSSQAMPADTRREAFKQIGIPDYMIPKRT